MGFHPGVTCSHGKDRLKFVVLDMAISILFLLLLKLMTLNVLNGVTTPDHGWFLHIWITLVFLVLIMVIGLRRMSNGKLCDYKTTHSGTEVC